MTAQRQMAECRTMEAGQRCMRWIGSTVILAVATVGLSGCVQVRAPDRPIEIVLTINIRQEIVYRLDGDAKAAIEQNTEIF
jgi:hypothetical protein